MGSGVGERVADGEGQGRTGGTDEQVEDMLPPLTGGVHLTSLRGGQGARRAPLREHAPAGRMILH